MLVADEPAVDDNVVAQIPEIDIDVVVGDIAAVDIAAVDIVVAVGIAEVVGIDNAVVAVRSDMQQVEHPVLLGVDIDSINNNKKN